VPTPDHGVDQADLEVGGHLFEESGSVAVQSQSPTDCFDRGNFALAFASFIRSKRTSADLSCAFLSASWVGA
jgi:hypothetical protein